MPQIRHSLALPTDLAAQEAVQRTLAATLVLTPSAQLPATWGAVDVAYSKVGPDRAAAVAVVMDARSHELLETAIWEGPPPHGYVPGHFALREAACLIAALSRLVLTPEVLLVDGQGIAHPRGFGLACHIGLTFDLPTIGVAKKHLFGTFTAPDDAPTSWSPLRHPEEPGRVLGGVLRTQAHVRPLFVSPGHRCDVETAVRWAAAARGPHRMLAPLRAADIFTRQVRDGRPLQLSEG